MKRKEKRESEEKSASEVEIYERKKTEKRCEIRERIYTVDDTVFDTLPIKRTILSKSPGSCSGAFVDPGTYKWKNKETQRETERN